MAGTTVAELVARLVADVSSFKRGLSEADQSITSTNTKMKAVGDAAMGLGKRLTASVSLPIAAAGFAAFKELEEAGRVSAQTNAVIKSTGGVAGVSAKHVRDLADAIMQKSGMDDEAIASGANLLLTFTKVRNEAGAGNDIFDQAVGLAADLSIAWGQDMHTSAIQLGKALNDPIKGVTALSKAGVQFTQAQRDQIATMVESGNVLGAQKIILKELETQVGGSAEAYGKTLAGQVSRAKEELLNSAAAIMSTAAPAIKFIAARAQEFATFLANLPGPLKALVGGLLGVAAVAGPALYIFGAFAKNLAAIRDLGPRATSVISGFGSAMRGLTIVGGVVGGMMALLDAMGAFDKITSGVHLSVENLSGKGLKNLRQSLSELVEDQHRATAAAQEAQEHGLASSTAQSSAQIMTAKWRDLREQFTKFAADAPTAAANFIKIAQAAGLPAAQIEKLKNILGETRKNVAGTADEIKKSALVNEGYSKSFAEVTVKADKFKQKLDELNGIQTDATQATIDYRNGMNELLLSMVANKGSLDLNTQAGRDNVAVVLQQKQKAEELAAAVLRQTGSHQAANFVLATFKAKLVDALVATGMSRDAAVRYTDALLKIPGERKTDIQNNAGAAAFGVIVYHNKIKEIPNSKTFTAYANTAQAVAAVNELKRLIEETNHTAYGNLITGRAAGGPVSKGQPYVVGEKRPELFVPKTDGMIYPSVPPASMGRPLSVASTPPATNIVVQIDGPVYGFEDFENRVTAAIINAGRKGGLNGAVLSGVRIT